MLQHTRKYFRFIDNYSFFYGTRVFAIRFSNKASLDLAQNEEILPYNAIPTTTKLLPFLGTTLDFIISGSGPKLHEFIDKRHKKLGPIFREPMGTIEVVFVNSPELMRRVFLYEGKCPRHPLPEAWILYNKKHGCERGLLFMDGEEWLHNRKIMNQVMLQNDTMWIVESVQRATAILIHNFETHLKRSTSTSVEINNLEGHLYRWSIQIIMFLMLGNSMDQKSSNELLDMIDLLADRVHSIFVSSCVNFRYIPASLAQKLNTNGWGQFEKTVTDTLELGKEIVNYSMEHFGTNDDGILMKMIKSGMPKDMIQRIFVDLIIAAGDTTAFSSQWTLYLIANDVLLQNKIREEIKNDPSNFETAMVKGTVREAMRLYPVAPFIGRFLDTDAVLGRYSLPKNTLVCLSLFTSGRDENNFTDPLQVSPSRWNRENTDHNREHLIFKPQASLPYGMGARSCVGRKIANTSMHCLISEILRKFKLITLNQNEVHPTLHLVTVPSEKIRISVEKNI